MPWLGDYYNVTGGWAEQRTAWWNMLQQIFGGEDVQKQQTLMLKSAIRQPQKQIRRCSKHKNELNEIEEGRTPLFQLVKRKVSFFSGKQRISCWEG